MPNHRLVSGPASVRRLFAAVAASALLAAGCGSNAPPSSTEPWGANFVEPADLVTELASANKPVVLCTAPPFMYKVGHIPGAVLHGPMTSPSVHEELTAWAQPLPRDTNVVIYCGCCPLAHCPNLRPAYKLLTGLGFTRVRVLILAENFGTDWAGRGYPTEH